MQDSSLFLVEKNSTGTQLEKKAYKVLLLKVDGVQT
jgi:hypothetical protein